VINSKVADFLAAVKHHDKRSHAAVERVLQQLVSWSLARPHAVTALIRDTQQPLVQFGFAGSDNLLWAARTFKTTGTYFTILGWRSSHLKNGDELILRARLNEIRTAAPLQAGQELRVGADDLDNSIDLQRFTKVLESLITAAAATETPRRRGGLTGDSNSQSTNGP
jgi:hypothetical protein